MPTVNVILWLHRGGQIAGAQILRDLLEENGFATRLIITSRDEPSDAYRADCNLFSSEISPLWMPLAPKNVLIPNQEQDVRQAFGRMHPTRFDETANQLSYLRLLDKLLVKTRHAQSVYQAHGLKTAYVGFTCRDRFLPEVEREVEPWLCVIGDSYTNKDVRPVLRVWRKNPQFPKLLVCLHNIPPGLKPLLVEMPNVVYRRRKLPDQELRLLQNRSTVHLCPSTMEGWGHAIVESMSAGAFLLTLGAPPMDEHVNESRGALFAYRDRAPHAFGFNHAINEASLEEAVRQAMNLSNAERRERGRRARDYFLQNDQQFRAAFVAEMKAILDAPASLNRGTGKISITSTPADDALPRELSPSAPVLVEISAGELLDKISILHIKRLRVKETAALANVMRELASLEAARARQLRHTPELQSLAAELEAVNAALWQTEDDLRVCEQKRDFGPAFTGLARSVYRLNDRRAGLKRRVNAATGSRLVEEKLHPDYQPRRRSNGVVNKLLREAIANQRANKPEAAEKCYRKVLSHDPQQADALHLLGLLINDRGDTAQAMELIRRALAIRPTTPEFHNSLGMLLGRADQYADAEVCFREALALRPEYPEATMNLGIALLQQGRIDESARMQLKSIALQPGSAEAHYNHAETLRHQDQIEQARDAYLKAIELKGDFAAAYNNLGICRRQLGQPDLAHTAFEKAIALKGDFAAAHWNHGMVLLLNGEWAEGWKEYAWRWRLKELSDQAARFKEPKWDGGKISGKTVLLHAEQGLGDTIQFIRYAPLLARRGAKVIIEVQFGLAELLRSVEGIDLIISRGQAIPPFDLHVPLVDLPGLFEANDRNLPAKTPYLHADPRLVSLWRDRLASLPSGLRVGLSWEGSAKPDPLRSCPATELRALANIDNITWISLQKNPKEPAPPELNLIDLPEANGSMEQTAAVISNLDLVISIDTAIAHLAGALGRPTWTLLPHCCDWRWMTARDDSIWYPTMRLFRQTQRKQWTSLLKVIAEALRSWIGSNQTEPVDAPPSE